LSFAEVQKRKKPFVFAKKEFFFVKPICSEKFIYLSFSKKIIFILYFEFFNETNMEKKSRGLINRIKVSTFVSLQLLFEEVVNIDVPFISDIAEISKTYLPAMTSQIYYGKAFF